jgi:diguanylate cyclase (GGDEF)-like protein
MAKSIELFEALDNSTNLPTLPGIARELLEISEWEDVDLSAVADIVSKDVSLTAKILRVVNSAFYGLSREVSTISQALVILGLRATRSLTLSFSVLSACPTQQTPRFDYAAFWTRSLNTATCAHALAGVLGFQTEEEAFLAGLLQDIGVLVLAHCVPDAYAPVLADTPDALAPSRTTERKHLGHDHVQVARFLFDKWNFPASLIIPITNHHSPDAPQDADHTAHVAIGIQYLSGKLGEWLYSQQADVQALEKLEAFASTRLAISPQELRGLLQDVDRRAEEYSALFDVHAVRPDTYTGLLQKANLVLGEITTEQESLVNELQRTKEEALKLSEQLRIANNRLLEEARTDPLTGLANRRMFRDFLNREIERAVRHGGQIALLFVDLDDFKSVNDTHGHLRGDALLRHVAAILSRQTRNSDILARYGGEEFVIALVEVTSKGAMTAAERVRSAVESTPLPKDADSVELQTTVSVGVVTWDKERGRMSPEALLAEADRAMYEAKRAGKNCVYSKPL